jgi:hypothetical protein
MDGQFTQSCCIILCMNQFEVPDGLSGTDAVVQWFGGWPDFHDAEVVSLTLARSTESLLRVCPYYPAKPAMVDFILEQVTDLELADFSVQNVISGLSVEARADQTDQKAVRITMGPCFGLSGWIDAKRVRLQVIPRQPATL